MTRVATLAMLLALVAPAAAHVGDRILPIFELSDAEAAAIDVHDGVVTDWQDVLGEPTLTAADFQRLPRPGLDFRLWLGWQRNTSRLYMAMERVDDVFMNHFVMGYGGGAPGHLTRPQWDMAFNDSFLALAVDADHTGSQSGPSNCGYLQGYPEGRTECLRRHSASFQHYNFLGVTAGGVHVRLEPHANTAHDTPPSFAIFSPWGETGGAVFSEDPYVSVTEAYVTLFTQFDYLDPEATVLADLHPGKVIGIHLATIDWDGEGVSYPPWIQLGGTYFFGALHDALLLSRATQVEAGEPLTVDSWARIKAGLLLTPAASKP